MTRASRPARAACVLVTLTAAVLPALGAVPAAASAAPPWPLSAYRELAAKVARDRLEGTVLSLAAFRTRHTASTDLVAGEGIAAAARWIREEMLGGAGDGPATVTFDEYLAEGARLLKPAPARNVMMLIPAAASWGANRYVVVAGHYDSRASDPVDFRSDAPGANDDGSGTAVVMEMARILGRRRFDANVLLVCVSGEEQGLHGSRHLARRAAERGWDVRAMITNDIVGNSLGQNGVRDAGRLRVFSEGVPLGVDEAKARLRVAIGGENDSPSRQLSRHAAEVLSAVFDDFTAMQVYRRDRMARGGDHIPFLEEGFPAVRFTEVNEHFRHQHQDVRQEKGVRYGDLPEFMDFDYLTRVARANTAVLASLADAPAEPRNVRITRGAEPDTTLAWDPVPDEDVAGYEVLRRATTAAVWEGAVFVAAPAARLTLAGVTVDNEFFAVRAVDRDGHRSIAVFPTGTLR
jgi:hypothetical protein